MKAVTHYLESKIIAAYLKGFSKVKEGVFPFGIPSGDIYDFERSQGTGRQLVMRVTLEMSIFFSAAIIYHF